MINSYYIRVGMLSFSALILSACGGSDTEDGGVNFTVTAAAEGGGSISPASQQVVLGQTANFTLTATSGNRINSVTGCNGALNGNSYTTGEVTADCTISASFGPQGYIVEVQASAGGSVQPEGLTVQQGDKAEFILTPELAYQVSEAHGCGGVLAGNTYTTEPIGSDCDINITFAPIGGGAVLGRYIDNGDGTITDPERKLMWMRCSFGQTWQNDTCAGDAAWASGGGALNLASLYNDGNFSDWRFPTLDELRSLVFCSSGTPSYWFGSNTSSLACSGDYSVPTVVQGAFPNTRSGANTYITSTVDETTSVRRYYHINFANGAVQGPDEAYGIHWRFVRNID
ncbi:DUF1566 domain-containing protein [Rheinheimera hassiensis]|uniref:DUF1566 domain-containing protein n=1 Tax=Rheinheimera hassiensis TaxID=1193627 RepID=UPI001F062C43|nr:DUF1566 domain-containing protein [Rheinheimera hassiensis]